MQNSTIAFTVFGSRISPRFDTFNSLLLIILDSKDKYNKTFIDFSNYSLNQKIDKLEELDINTLVCGAIESSDFEIISNKISQVLYGVTGEYEEIFEYMLKNASLSDKYLNWNGGYCNGRGRRAEGIKCAHFGRRNNCNRNSKK